MLLMVEAALMRPLALPTTLVGGLWRSRWLGVVLEASVETVSRRNLKGRVKAEVEAAVAVRARRIDGFMVGCCVVVL